MSTRGTIINTVKTELETISTANGYQSDLNKTRIHNGVLLDRPGTQALHTIKPTLCIVDGLPDSPLLYSSGTTVKRMSLGVAAFMESEASTDSPRDVVDKIVADMIKLIHKPIALGSNVRYVVLSEIVTNLISEEEGEAHMLFVLEINYWYTNATP